MAACATTHEFAPSAMPAVAPVAARPPYGHQPQTPVLDVEGDEVPFRPSTPMVLHVASGRRHLRIETQPSELNIQPTGVWVRSTFVPAGAVLGFEGEDSNRGTAVAAAVIIPLGAVAALLIAMSLSSGSPECRSHGGCP